MRRLALLMLVVSLPGCLLYFDDGGRGDDQCDLAAPAEEPSAALRNPENLLCEPLGGSCDPRCGPCPAVAELSVPDWGICGSDCEGLDELSCSERADCRVVKDLRCAVSLDCRTDFVGCFPTAGFVDPAVDCLAARDGETCSRNPACTAFHTHEACPFDAPCPTPYRLCMPEGAHPGQCFDTVLCDAIAPDCPSGTTPGIINGCYSGACIPLDVCEPPPPEPNQ